MLIINRLFLLIILLIPQTSESGLSFSKPEEVKDDFYYSLPSRPIILMNSLRKEEEEKKTLLHLEKRYKNFLFINQDILLKVVGFLGPEDRINLSATCHSASTNKLILPISIYWKKKPSLTCLRFFFIIDNSIEKISLPWKIKTLDALTTKEVNTIRMAAKIGGHLIALHIIKRYWDDNN